MARKGVAVLAEAPDLSLALALKAESLVAQAVHGSRPRPCLEQARACMERALDTAAPAWHARGMVLQALNLDGQGAGEAYARALESSGGEAATYVWYQNYLVGRGRPREAIAILQRTVDHFGYSNPKFLSDLAMLQMLARDYPAAQETIQAALAAAPHSYQRHLNWAILLEAQDDPAGALRVLDETPLAAGTARDLGIARIIRRAEREARHRAAAHRLVQGHSANRALHSSQPDRGVLAGTKSVRSCVFASVCVPTRAFVPLVHRALVPLDSIGLAM